MRPGGLSVQKRLNGLAYGDDRVISFLDFKTDEWFYYDRVASSGKQAIRFSLDHRVAFAHVRLQSEAVKHGNVAAAIGDHWSTEWCRLHTAVCDICVMSACV